MPSNEMSIERITSNLERMPSKDDNNSDDSGGKNDDYTNEIEASDSKCNVGDWCKAFWIRLGKDILNIVRFAILGVIFIVYWSLFWVIWVLKSRFIRILNLYLLSKFSKPIKSAYFQSHIYVYCTIGFQSVNHYGNLV